jgi:hypothetical protein
MDLNKAGRFINLLANNTSKGVLGWEKTASDDMFQTSLSGFVVRVSHNDSDDFFISIYNSQGEQMDRYMDDDFDMSDGLRYSADMHDQMEAIFNGARRKAMGVEDALDKMVFELRQADDDDPPADSNPQPSPSNSPSPAGVLPPTRPWIKKPE